MVQIAAGKTYRVPNTLLSDTEESVLGTEWHQEAIEDLAGALGDIADLRGAHWGVCRQIALQGLRHEDGTSYEPHPDVMVLAQPLPRGSMAGIHIDVAGPPLFVAEVASESTRDNDLGEKRQAYAAVGVAEYLVFDLGEDLLEAPVLAWRLEEGRYVTWRPDAAGWWHSAALEVSLRPMGPLLDVRDRDGALLERSGAVRRAAEERAAAETMARLAAEERAAAETMARLAAEERAAAMEEEIAQLRDALDRVHRERPSSAGEPD